GRRYGLHAPASAPASGRRAIAWQAAESRNVWNITHPRCRIIRTPRLQAPGAALQARRAFVQPRASESKSTARSRPRRTTRNWAEIEGKTTDRRSDVRQPY